MQQNIGRVPQHQNQMEGIVNSERPQRVVHQQHHMPQPSISDIQMTNSNPSGIPAGEMYQ